MPITYRHKSLGTHFLPPQHSPQDLNKNARTQEMLGPSFASAEGKHSAAGGPRKRSQRAERTKRKEKHLKGIEANKSQHLQEKSQISDFWFLSPAATADLPLRFLETSSKRPQLGMGVSRLQRPSTWDPSSFKDEIFMNWLYASQWIILFIFKFFFLFIFTFIGRFLLEFPLSWLICFSEKNILE